MLDSAITFGWQDQTDEAFEAGTVLIAVATRSFMNSGFHIAPQDRLLPSRHCPYVGHHFGRGPELAQEEYPSCRCITSPSFVQKPWQSTSGRGLGDPSSCRSLDIIPEEASGIDQTSPLSQVEPGSSSGTHLVGHQEKRPYGRCPVTQSLCRFLGFSYRVHLTRKE